MALLLEYLVKSAIAMAVFYTFYWLFLRRGTHFILNRVILLFSLLLAFVLPLINLNLVQPEPVIPVLNINFEPETVGSAIATTAGKQPGLELSKIFIILYLIGAGIVFLRLVCQGIYLHALSRLSQSEKQSDFTLVYMKKDIIPFSYFNKIFIPESVSDHQGIKGIIDHERSHLKQMHFLDLFLIELITIIQWFNPFAWLYERSVKEVHEYLADREVLNKGYNQGKYQALLVNQAMGGPVFTIANQFNQSLIKKRIVMMTKMKSPRLAQLKGFLLLPLIAILLMAYNQPEKAVEALNYPLLEKAPVDNEASSRNVVQNSSKNNRLTSKSEEQIKVEGKVISFETNKAMPGVFVVIKGTTEGAVTDADGKYAINVPDNNATLEFSCVGYQSQAIPVKWEKRIDVMMREYAVDINLSGPNYLVAPEKSPSFSNSKGDVFVAVEELPSYPGGTDALKKFIAENLKYPAEAKQKGITGMVVVNFVIDKEGNIVNPKIWKNVEPLLDEEALRVVSLIKGWKPGMQNGKPIACKVNLPVQFK